MGLSVGQSVSITMSMERSFGELRIADFDSLELTNLNRIRTGVQNLGLPKTTIVAREIAEIDPFLKVTIFKEGLTEDNIDDFLTRGGQLDVLVDECDGLEMKVLMREKANPLGIPVVMDMSDRGVLDIERFDVNKDYPLLHGLIEGLNYEKLAQLKTYEEKVPFLLPIIDDRTLSKRLKASMVEIGTSLVTWPQLASAVAYGGAVAGDICRKILLKHEIPSGRFILDLNELVSPKTKIDFNSLKDPKTKFIAQNQVDLNASSCDEFFALKPKKDISDEVKSLIHSIVKRAPSAGNSQSWGLKFNGDLVLLSSYNILEEIALTNLAAMAFYLESALGTKGVQQLVSPKSNKHHYTVIYRMVKSPEIDELRRILKESPLVKRQTDRSHKESYVSSGVSPEFKQLIEKYKDSFNIEIISSSVKTNQLTDLILLSDLSRILHEPDRLELFERELTMNENDTSGIFIQDLHLDPTKQAGFRMIADPDVVKIIGALGLGSGLRKLIEEKVESSDCFLAITKRNDVGSDEVFECRKQLFKLWCDLVEIGYSFHPYTSVVYVNKSSSLTTSNEEYLKRRDKILLDEFSINQEDMLFFVRMHISDKTENKPSKRRQSILIND